MNRRVSPTRPVIACLALAVAACAAAEEGTFERVLDVSGPVELEVVSGSGSITIRAGASDTVRVHGTIRSRDSGKVSRLEQNPPIEQNGNVIRVGFIEDRELTVMLAVEASTVTAVSPACGCVALTRMATSAVSLLPAVSVI